MKVSNSATKRLGGYGADTAIILGSGLNAIVAEPKKDQVVPYAEFSEIPKPTVEGHLGQFILDEMEKTKIVFSQGRVHLYEGHSAREVTSIVRVLARAGINQLIVTNAAGALNPKFKPGEWMMIADHINLTGQSPLVGRDNASPARTRARSIAPGRRDPPIFVDMTNAYTPRLREKFRAAAKNANVILHEGVYAGLVGSQYETPAEVRVLQKFGADAVGMSTVLEGIEARARGIEVAGFSCLISRNFCRQPYRVFENSPAFQGWENLLLVLKVPLGRQKHSFVLPDLILLNHLNPALKRWAITD